MSYDFVVYHIVFGLSNNQLTNLSKLVYIYLLINVLRKDFLYYDETFNSLGVILNVSNRSIYRALNDLLNYGFIDYVKSEKRLIILMDLREYDFNEN